MSVPKVAVIVCTYNMAHYLRESLDSVLKLRYPNLEIIVVDDGSTDGTEELVKENYSGKVIYIRQENRGLFAARNAGITAAGDADYYSIVDADDRVHPLRVWDEVAFLERFANTAICFSNIVTFEKEQEDSEVVWDAHNRVLWDGNDLIGSDRLWGEIEYPIEKISKYNAFTSLSTLRATAMRAVGNYDDTLKCSGDLDLAIRLTRLGGAGFINKPRYFHRNEGQGMTSYMRDRIVTNMRIFEKVWENASDYSGEELRLLKQKERGFLLGAIKGIAKGRVDPKLRDLVRQEFLKNGTWREKMEMDLIMFTGHLGIVKAISNFRAGYRRKFYDKSINLEEVLKDMIPCFDCIVPKVQIITFDEKELLP